MTTESLASRVTAKVADDYRRRGYTVDIAPRGTAIPAFLSDFEPDLIARSPTDSVVVEVKVGTRTSVAERFRDVAERVDREPGWRFSLVFVSPDQPDQIFEAQPAPLPVLQNRIRNADTLRQSGQSEAAFLLLWSAVEGTLRLLGQRSHVPAENLPPSALIRELYSAGEISRDQFERLIELLPVRNQVVHGVGTPPEALPVEELAALTRALLAEVVTPQP